MVRSAWRGLSWCAAIGPRSRAGRRFGKFGANSIICFPANTILNERYIHIGEGTMIGPQVTLSAGMMPGQECLTESVVRIGDRCLIGKGSGIVGHLSIDIGNDVWTGHHVYITDQNHGYEDVTRPISQQLMPEKAVVIGDGSWLGFGTVVLAGSPDRSARDRRRQLRRDRRATRLLRGGGRACCRDPSSRRRRRLGAHQAAVTQASPPSSPGGMQWGIALPVVKSMTTLVTGPPLTTDSRYGSSWNARSRAVYFRRSSRMTR